jgi:hypothetical protein
MTAKQPSSLLNKLVSVHVVTYDECEKFVKSENRMAWKRLDCARFVALSPVMPGLPCHVILFSEVTYLVT